MLAQYSAHPGDRKPRPSPEPYIINGSSEFSIFAGVSKKMIRFLQSGNRAVKFILSAFLLLICVSMVWYLVPSGNLGDVNTAGVVAKIGGEEITVADVQRKAADIERQQGRQVPDFLRPYMM